MPSELTRKHLSPESISEFIGGTCDLLLSAFPDQILSLYLTGSWARGDPIDTSDVDLVVVVRTRTSRAAKGRLRTFIGTLNRLAPIRLDAAVYAELELKKGILPYLKHHKLLAGKHLLRNAPVLASAVVNLNTAEQALRFMRMARGSSSTLSFPLRYPSPRKKYFGYDVFGTRPVGGGFEKGLNTLVNLVMFAASYRQLVFGGESAHDKQSVMESYRRLLPNDPWLPLIAETYTLCRIQCQGQLPRSKAQQSRLSRLCGKILSFENAFIDTLIETMNHDILPRDRRLRRRANALLNTIQVRSTRRRMALGATART